MNKIPLIERFKIFFINILKDFINFNYYLLWFLLDPKKFTIIKKEKIKSIIVISGGAVGDIYNVLGSINELLENYKVKIYFLTSNKNREYNKNPKIKIISLKEAKKLLDKKEIDAAILIDPGRNKEIFDRELFLKIIKLKYVSSTDSIKLHPKKIIRQLPIFASRKVFPLRANGPKSLIKVFNLLSYKIERPKFYFTKKGNIFAQKFLKDNRCLNNQFIVVHIGAGKIVNAMNEGKIPAHLWPLDRWSSLINKLIENTNKKIILTGVKSEGELVKKVYNLVSQKNKVVYAVGKIPDIESLASIVKRADTTITLDTSMAHITSQVGTPAVVLFSSDSPKRIGPISNKNINIYHPKQAHDCRKYACKYCHEVHMKSITVDEVYNSVIKLLNNS